MFFLRVMAIALVMASWARGDVEAHRVQEAFFDTATVTLRAEGVPAPDAESEDGLENVPCPSIRLQPFPGVRRYGISEYGWDCAALLFGLSLVFAALEGAVAWRRFRQSPRQRRLRSARRRLKGFSGGGGTLEDALDALRERFELPAGTSLTQLSEAVEGRHRELAEACRQLELERWSGGGARAETVARLRKALRRLVVLVACLLAGGCFSLRSGRAFSAWGHGVMLAHEGRTAEALETFLELEDRLPSSPELSRNIAVLVAVLPLSEVSETAALSVSARQCHASALQAVEEPWGAGDWRNGLPEVSLALSGPFLCAAVLLAFRRRKGLCLAAIAAFLAAASLCCHRILEAETLSGRAVASAGARVQLTPDSCGESLQTLSVPCVVELERGCAAVNGFRRVRLSGGGGWIAQERLLGFRLSAVAAAED